MENVEERIAEAVALLYYEGGSAAVTVRKVAQQLGISEGTVYSRYQRTEQLLEAGYSQALERISNPPHFGIYPYKDPDPARFEAAIAFHLEHHYETVLAAGAPVSVAYREKQFERLMYPRLRHFLEEETKGRDVDQKKALQATVMMLFAYVSAVSGLAKRRLPNTPETRATILSYVAGGYRLEMEALARN